MEDLKSLVVRPVAGLVDVEQRHHQARPLGVAADAAGRLDVLGAGLRLTEHDHQPQPRDVQTHGNHVGGDGHIDPVFVVERSASRRFASATLLVWTREVSSTTS